MRAVLRLGMAIAAAGLWLGQVPAFAQSAPAPTTNTPATDTIGPRELQNFSLEGNVTRPADQRPATQPPQALRSTTVTRPLVSEQRPVRPQRTAREEPRPSQTSSGASTANVQPPAALPATETAAPSPASQVLPDPTATESPTDLAPERTLPIWPWLLAALVLGVGGALLLWRRNSRHAFAGGAGRCFRCPRNRASTAATRRAGASRTAKGGRTRVHAHAPVDRSRIPPGELPC